tara:strand:+ start:607 stop:1050 length:444 start_codon:yes stop_codon:yes gene_type:complete
MNKYFLLITLSFIFFINCQENQEMLNLKNFEWENRVLIIGGHGSKFKSQLDQINFEDKEFIDRNLVIILLEENNSKISYDGLKTIKTIDYDSTLSIRNKYDFKNFKLLLIGKDGGEKYNSNEPVNINVIYELIDAMPMRKQEIEERN